MGSLKEVFSKSKDRFDKDKDAFIFSLTNYTKHNIRPNKIDNAIYNNKDYLTVFGCNDIIINNNCHDTDGGWCYYFGGVYDSSPMEVYSTEA